MRLTILSACFCCLSALSIPAQTEDAESFRIEATAAYWRLGLEGDIRSGSTQVNLRSDLGMRDSFSTFAGKLALKPGRKHRVLFEGSPYRLDGTNVLSRQITYAGKTYSINETVSSKADLSYFFGGYQYDFVSRKQGHFGVLGGVAYVNASGTISSAARTASDSITVPLPLAGVEFRGYLIPKSRLLNFNGEVKGMSFGDYGRYIHGSFNFGVGLGRHFTVQAGYAILDMDIHKNNSSEAAKLRFTGPTVSIQVRDR